MQHKSVATVADEAATDADEIATDAVEGGVHNSGYVHVHVHGRLQRWTRASRSAASSAWMT